ncbi:MAG: alpha/beta fold hydrolase [Candidatus Lokiarchaeota archaeon]|nr:alpha/beta fold hydrolase [Candidatus Lokiarchaeota archaeon]
MIEQGQLEFSPHPLVTFTWRPDDPKMEVIGVIAALHGFAVHARLGFHYLGPFFAERGWIVVAPDLPGLGHWPEPRGMPGHWELVPAAVAALLRRARELAGDKPVVLLGSSLGGLAAIDHVLRREERRGERDKCVDAVVAMVPAIGIPSLPWYLMALAGIALLFAPRARVGLKKYARPASHDPNSIILHPEPDPDPYILERVSIKYLSRVFMTMWKSGIRGQGQARWDARIPLYLVSAGNDDQVNPAHVKAFHDGLPAGTTSALLHKEGDYHGVLYEADRKEVFEEIHTFLVKTLKLL